MNDLETIIATALIGTERQPPPAISLEPNLTGETREATLLSAAALVSAYRRAGYVPQTGTATLEPSDMDTKPEMTSAMRDLLHRVLSHGELVTEYLELLGTKGVRLSHRDLPLMLDNGRQSTYQRALITPLLDTRGRWLARLNKNWAWATGNTESLEDAVASFETGSKSARSLAFQTIRETDPSRALALLETTWKQEAAPERKEFIALLNTKLSDTDETFLETALIGDRSSDVRDTAAELLAQLPNSAFNARTRSYLKPILRVTKPKAKNILERVKDGVQEAVGVNNAKLEIELPETFDPEWAKDGIQEKAPQSVGQKQWWVQQLLRRATLPMLEEITGLDAVTLLKNTHKDWKGFVQTAVSTALNQHPTRDLVKRLIAYDITLVRGSNAFSVLEPSFLETLVTQRSLVERNTELTLLHACTHQWSEAFWIKTLEWIALQTTRLQQGAFSQYFYGFAGIVVRSTPLPLIPRVLNGHPSLPTWTALLSTYTLEADKKQKNQWYWEYTQREIRNLLESLHLRLEMHEVMR
ncbi:MAG: hypothetical protein HC933_12580 [Pleurocapsa sp. SU_196_0]|nr:hypothetical protein [Pleurocapsa sp. SU_196_0]